MKRVIFLLLITTRAFAQHDYTQYVDPFIGTGGHGHTFPGPTMPFGMVQISPDTRLDTWDGCSGYHYSDHRIYGFSHTHLSGTGCSDYGDVLLMPMLGTPKFKSGEYSSAFSKTNEKASLGYYSVLLDRDKIKVELAATTRAGIQKYTFPKSDRSNVILDLNHRDSLLEGEINIVGNNEISGLRLSHGWAAKQYVYFVIQFSKPFKKFGIKNGMKLNEEARQGKGNVLKAYVSFETTEGEVIYARVGISPVSVEGARRNLQTELPFFDIEKVVTLAKQAWNKELSKIEVQSENMGLMRTFYTAMYHAMIAPNTYQDVDGKYRGRDLQVHEARDFSYYTVFSLWDTYRAWHPLMALIDKKRTGDYINTFIKQYEQAHRLPVWELSANETNCMIGYHSVPVIVDAYMKGVRGFDFVKALEAMQTSATEAKNGLWDYMEYGYIKHKSDDESVSKTLEYAYDDWCIAQFAHVLDKPIVHDIYIKRAQNYKNLFDPKTLFMRPREQDFVEPFDPYEVTHDYTEGNAWQYTYYVPQDMTGLMSLMGGKEKFASRLDSIFHTSSVLRGHAQPDISGMIGQYAHGNEPSHQIAYEYDYAGQPWKTQEMVRKICTELYHDQPDGLSGNEDCGQMSAWYILSALGFYPVCPGDNQYALGSPMFDRAEIHLENGKRFIITTENNAPERKYIHNATMNNAAYTKFYITYDDIAQGGTMNFVMAQEPRMEQDVKDADLPVTAITTK